jgi:creatinine amidohydrolase/Fe(II)-dependent formamide hydrolase-like protein
MRRLVTCLAIVALLAAGRARGQTQSVLIEDLTWTEVRAAIAAGKTTAIYYAGSIEQNGPGLALGKHLFLAHYIAQQIARRLGNALVYPTMPFAPTGDPIKRTGHMRFPGSVNVSEETFGAVARDVAASAIAAGFRNVVLMGDHGGGQKTLEAAAKALDEEWAPKGAHVYYIGDVYYKEKEQMRAYAAAHALAVDQHAGYDDTSEVLFIDADGKWVRKDKLVKDTGASGVTGDQTAATIDIGRMSVENKINDAVAQIRSFVK